MVNYKIGQVIKCRVTGIEKYGIFVEVNKRFTGLIHISEVSNDFVRNINDYVKMNDMIFAKIINIDTKENKMKLSIKDIDYKNTGKKKQSLESGEGFIPLRDALVNWIKDKINEINKKTSSK